MPLSDSMTRIVNRLNAMLGSRPPDDPRLLAIYEKCRDYVVRAQLEKTIAETRFIIIDTETTGFKVYAGDEMISIAMLEYQGLAATGRQYSQFINPGRPIPAETTAIHGIHDEDVAHSPLIEEILPEIAEFIDDGILIGHHINFDQRFLNKYLKQYVGCQLRNLLLDTMLLFTTHSGRMGHYTLDEVASYCQHTPVERHTALGDAMAAAAIFECLVPRLCAPDDLVESLYNQQFSNAPE